jgi:hypothetical protein
MALVQDGEASGLAVSRIVVVGWLHQPCERTAGPLAAAAQLDGGPSTLPRGRPASTGPENRIYVNCRPFAAGGSGTSTYGRRLARQPDLRISAENENLNRLEGSACRMGRGACGLPHERRVSAPLRPLKRARRSTILLAFKESEYVELQL